MKTKEIFGLSYERNKKQAFIFFLVYALILLVIYMILTSPFCWNVQTYDEGYSCANAVSAGPGKIISALISSIFTLLILFKKRTNTLAKIGLVLSSAALGYVGGIWLSLIMTSTLTTGESK